jgi:hypothetical protein
LTQRVKQNDRYQDDCQNEQRNIRRKRLIRLAGVFIFTAPLNKRDNNMGIAAILMDRMTVV